MSGTIRRILVDERRMTSALEGPATHHHIQSGQLGPAAARREISWTHMSSTCKKAGKTQSRTHEVVLVVVAQIP
jgi:hypothetical protein